MKQVGIMPDATMISLLVFSGLVASNIEAKRLLESGGVYVNGETYRDTTLPDFRGDSFRLRRGKKKVFNEVKVVRAWDEVILRLKND